MSAAGRRTRAVLGAAAVVLLAVVVALGALLLAGEDDPRTAVAIPSVPVAAGNVRVEVADARAAATLRAWARRIGADDRPAVRALGQAVEVRVRPGTVGALVRAGGAPARFAGPEDPALRAYITAALGG